MLSVCVVLGLKISCSAVKTATLLMLWAEKRIGKQKEGHGIIA